MYYRNTGAPIHVEGPDGGVMVPKGALFAPTARELRMFSYKLEPVEQPGPTDVIVSLPTPSPSVPSRWTLSMRPELYLKLHPEGIHAALAREVCLELGTPLPVPDVPTPWDVPMPETKTAPTLRDALAPRKKREKSATEETPRGPDD